MKTELKKQLDKLARLVNSVDNMLKNEHGSSAYLYFEAEGSIHAMLKHDEYTDINASDRQKLRIEKKY